MSPSALERHDLEQGIDELRSSIESLESSRSRLRDLVASGDGGQSGSVWSDLTEIVSDFFQFAGEAINQADDDDDGGEGDDALTKAGKTAKKVKTVAKIDWGPALSDSFARLRDRVSGDLGNRSAPPPVAELGDVLGELDSELARLGVDLQQKLDRAAELDRTTDDDAETSVHPHHRDRATVGSRDDDLDVIPIPVDVLPEVDIDPVVVPDNDTDVVLPTPIVDIDVMPVVDVTPVPDVVTPVEDDTPAYDTGKQTEIGELDGAIYDVNEILAGGHTVADLRRADVPAGVMRDAGVLPSAMLEGGYTLAELHEAGYQVGDLHGLAGAADMRAAGYVAGDLHGVFSASECIEAFSPHELRDAGFSVSDFHGLVSASDIRDVFSVSELRTVYSVGELRSAGFDAGDLSTGGIGWEELAAAGFTRADLESAGAGEATLREIFPSDLHGGDDDD